ncbi:MAG: NAD(P)-dependent alcohol dehydrogenase [Bacteroidia bacterium]
MKACVYTKYGPPEVVKITEIPKPEPKDDEVLIKIHSTTVNRTDCGFRSAEYFVSRFFSGLWKPKLKVLGNEFAGEIETIGRNVTTFKIGDKVFGYNDSTFGAHAEYMTLPENTSMTTMPQNTTFEEAAAICEGAHYALKDIRAAKVKVGQNVLVYGATGAIGSAAVQLLKHFGAHVTAVCHTKNTEIVKSLGAELVIDYTKEDYAKAGRQYDFVFDAVGKTSFAHCKNVLTQKGIYISTELGKNWANIFLALSTPISGGKKVLFPIPTINKKDVIFLKELFESGKFKPVIDGKHHFTLAQIVDAYKYVETGQKTGNVVISVIQ